MAGAEQPDFRIPLDWLRREEISFDSLHSIVPNGKSLHPDILLKIVSQSALQFTEEPFRWKTVCFRIEEDEGQRQRHQHVTEEGVQALRDMADAGLLNNLETLVWDYLLEYHSAAAQKALGACFEAIQFTNLQHLDLRHNYIGYDGAVIIAEVVKSGKLITLRYLDLTYNSLDDYGTQVIGSALESGKLLNLRHLSLRGNIMGPVGARAISTPLLLGKIVALEHLDLSENDISDEGAQLVSEVMQSGKLAMLKYLGLRLALINEGGTDIAKGLQHGKVTALQHLDISFNNLDVGPSKAIAKALGSGKVPDIQILNLTDNYFSDEGGVALAEALQSLPAIRHLEIKWDFIGKDSAMALASGLQSGKIPALQYLDIGGNDLGEDGRAALEEAARAGKIEKLELQEEKNEDATLALGKDLEAVSLEGSAEALPE